MKGPTPHEPHPPPHAPPGIYRLHPGAIGPDPRNRGCILPGKLSRHPGQTPEGWPTTARSRGNGGQKRKRFFAVTKKYGGTTEGLTAGRA